MTQMLKKRCGCDCKNATEYEACENEIPCCENCPAGAPCAYAIKFECEIDCGFTGVGLVANPITVLWKDCLFDCTWSARLAVFGDPLGLITGATLIDEIAGFPTNADGEDCENLLIPNGADGEGFISLFPPVWQNADGSLEYRALPFKCCQSLPLKNKRSGFGPNGPFGSPYSPWSAARCGWRDFYEMDATSVTLWANYITNSTRVLWDLEIISSGTAEIRGYDKFDGTLRVTYTCDSFSCLGENTFVRQGEYPDNGGITGGPYDYPGQSTFTCVALPNKICVSPYTANWVTPCNSPDSACACKDPGSDSVSYTITTNCAALNGTIAIADRNATLPACISTPSPAPCGYFYASWGVVNTTFHLLVWCDGTEYQVKLYCGAAASCTLICETPATTVSFCPNGANISWRCDDLGDCCTALTPITTECCGDDPVANTLYATTTAASCATMNGLIITLTYAGVVGGWFRWSGEFTPTNAGTCATPFTFYFEILDGISCEYRMYIKESDGGTVWGDPASSGDGAITCPFATATTGAASLDACIVRIMAPTCAGTMSATVTP